jgi:hypothetical protein
MVVLSVNYSELIASIDCIVEVDVVDVDGCIGIN